MERFSRFLTVNPDHLAGHLVLAGPRGSGKTTWCAQRFPHAARIDLGDERTFAKCCGCPERLMQEVTSSLRVNVGREREVIVDDIHRITALYADILGSIATAEGWRFILTTSTSGLPHRERGAEIERTLARRTLHPYMAAEVGDSFDLQAALRYGMLPAVWADADRATALHVCNGHYHREIQNDRVICDISEYKRFLEALSLQHGRVLDLSTVARGCKIKRYTAEIYMNVFEERLLGFQVPALKRPRGRKAMLPGKFYFFDTGAFHANRPTGLMDTTWHQAAVTLEGLVAQHLRAWCDYSAGACRLYSWQGPEGAEVDFVVLGDSIAFAVDVVNSNRVRADDLRGLRSLASDYPLQHRYLLHRGERHFVEAGIECLPCAAFLTTLLPHGFPAPVRM